MKLLIRLPNPKIQLSRSSWHNLPVNFDDYTTYLNKANMDIGKLTDPTSYDKALINDQSLNGIKLLSSNSLRHNSVCNLVELPNGSQQLVERYKSMIDCYKL